MGLKLAFDYPPDLRLTGAVQLGSHTLSLYSQISYPVTGRAYPLVSISSLPPPPPSVTLPSPQLPVSLYGTSSLSDSCITYAVFLF